MTRRLGLAVLATVLLAGLVLAVADLREPRTQAALADAFTHLTVAPLAVSFALYAASYLGRAWRLRVLLGRGSIAHLATVAARHNLLNLLLPFRSGEASLPLMIRNETGGSLAEGAAALLVARVQDLGSVAAWCLLGAAAGGDALGATLLLRVALVLGVVLGALAAMRPIAGMLARRVSPEGRVGGFVSRTCGHMVALPASRLLVAGAVSLLTWLLTYGACWAIVVAMAAPSTDVGAEHAALTFGQGLVGTTFLHLTALLPVNTLAGVGAWEAGWVAGYAGVVGLSTEAALASAVVGHALILGFIVVLGGGGFLYGRRLRARSPETRS